MRKKRPILTVYLCLLLIATVAIHLLYTKRILLGVYGWQLKQPETLVGGLEIVFIFCAILLIMYVTKNISKIPIFCIIFLSVVYLRLHHVLEPTLLALIYFESIIFIGSRILLLVGVEQKKGIRRYFEVFVVGFVVWSVLAITLSMAKLGSFNDLRILTLVLCIVLIIMTMKKGLHIPLSWEITRAFNRANKYEKIGLLSIYLLVIIQFAKSNRAIDYDSIWYGLRPEYILMGNHSIYDNLGLVQFVHYYPKLFELFLLPISNLGDYSFIYAGTTMFLVMLTIVVFDFIRVLGGSKLESSFITFIIISTPAISNMASTAKTDIFSAFFIILCAYYLVMFVKNKYTIQYFILAFSSGTMSLGGKMSSFMYILVIFFVFIIFMCTKINELKEQNVYLKNKAYIKSKQGRYTFSILLLSLMVFFGIHYRTYLLTGYPMYPLFGELWSKLGFDLKYPLTNNIDLALQEISLSGFLQHWYTLLFDFGKYSHYVMIWPGILATFLFLILLGLMTLNRIFFKKYWRVLMIVSFLLAVDFYYKSTLQEGGDGNYYIITVILIILGCLYPVINLEEKRIKKMIYFIVVLFIPFQFMLMFVSHWSWSWGTEKVEYKLNNTFLDTKEANKYEFLNQGLEHIVEYVEKQSTDDQEIKKCVAFENNTPVFHRLPCSFESLNLSSMRFGNPELFITTENFKNYLSKQQIDYLIVPIDPRLIENSSLDIVYKVIDELKAKNNLYTVYSDDFILYDLTKEIDNNDSVTQIILKEGWYEDEGSFRWINKSAKATVVNNSNKEYLVLDGTIPNVYDEITLSIVIDGIEKEKKTLVESEFHFVIPVDKDEMFDVEIRTDASFIPKQEQQSEDIRELSIIINNFSLK